MAEIKKKIVKEEKEKYIESIGRRKTAIARVRIFPGKKSANAEISINEKKLNVYFPSKKYQDVVLAPFNQVFSSNQKIHTTVNVKGGGVNAQAEAVRLGISRGLLTVDNEFRSKLKPLGFLKRDPRMVERKKFGLRKARRPQQWRKR